MSDLGHIIGWHSQLHKPMSTSKELLINDLMLGKKFLEEINPNSPKHLSYPYGREDAIPFRYLKNILNSSFDYGWILGDNKNYKNYKEFTFLLQSRLTPNEVLSF